MDKRSKTWWRAEAALLGVAITAVVFLLFGKPLLNAEAPLPVLGASFVWLFGMIIWGAIAVVRHADSLATRLGEPYGTLILTLSAISIEVSGGSNPYLARDAMYGVLMIVLNGLVGGSLLLGGLRHREPEVNIEGARAYLAVLITISVLGMVLPDYTEAAAVAMFSDTQALLMALAALFLYAIFLWIQTVRHRDYFTSAIHRDGTRVPYANTNVAEAPAHGDAPAPYKTWIHTTLLIGGLVPIFLLCKKLAVLLALGIDRAHAPPALGGFLVALLVLTPEGMGALRAAWHNQMQRAMNISLGSALATIGLTIPAVLTASLLLKKPVALGLGEREVVLLQLTLLVSVITFSGRRTNILLGAVHLIIFAAYFVVIFDRLPAAAG
jgi:Ca2+:H+ antiporter